MSVRPGDALDVLVVGAGQAGLALGYHLRSTGVQFELYERHDRLGTSWRQRYDSLKLFTPRAYSALPGLEVPGDPDGYAGKDEIADYLERYAAAFALPVRLGANIGNLAKTADSFVARLADGTTLTARVVVIASGAYQRPAIPGLAAGLSETVRQLTPISFRNAGSAPPGTVLVVGDGASGRQIARDLADEHEVLLASGRPRATVRDRLLGRSTFWWLDHLGLDRVGRDSLLGRRLRARDAFPARGLDERGIAAAGIERVPRVTGAAGTEITFAGGSTSDVASVIWATGYRDESDWVQIDGAADERGTFVAPRGVSPVPNLFFVGRPWQTSLGSGLLLGVGADAARVATLAAGAARA